MSHDREAPGVVTRLTGALIMGLACYFLFDLTHIWSFLGFGQGARLAVSIFVGLLFAVFGARVLGFILEIFGW